MITKQEAMEMHGCNLLMEATSEEELIDLQSELPTDTHLVYYTKDYNSCMDAVRAYKMVDIFDVYHTLGYTLLGIQSGFGSIKPGLFQDARNDGDENAA